MGIARVMDPQSRDSVRESVVYCLLAVLSNRAVVDGIRSVEYPYEYVTRVSIDLRLFMNDLHSAGPHVDEVGRAMAKAVLDGDGMAAVALADWIIENLSK